MAGLEKDGLVNDQWLDWTGTRWVGEVMDWNKMGWWTILSNTSNVHDQALYPPQSSGSHSATPYPTTSTRLGHLQVLPSGNARLMLSTWARWFGCHSDHWRWTSRNMVKTGKKGLTSMRAVIEAGLASTSWWLLFIRTNVFTLGVISKFLFPDSDEKHFHWVFTGICVISSSAPTNREPHVASARLF